MLDNESFDEPIEYPITNELDLHTFPPDETESLVTEYLNECRHRGIYKVRIIHGKGKSVQKFIVHKTLESNHLVEEYVDAPPESGGWGATIVVLKK